MNSDTTPACPIAIIGLGAVMPDAPNVKAFWRNILEGRDSIRQVPPERWAVEDYYNPDASVPDKSYTRIGAFVADFRFDPLAWRIPPRVAESMDPVQQWAITAAHEALDDAGLLVRAFDRSRCAVVLGNALAGERHYMTAMRVHVPRFARALATSPTFQSLAPEQQRALLEQFSHAAAESLPPITEDTMPGELANIIAGRVAAAFDLRGPNFTTDAACASSLAALQAAAAGLAEGRYDLVLTGGADSSMSPHCFVKFCKIGALSPDGSRPFDRRANGFVMGEGCGVLLLKRLADAERDGDRVYAVLRAIGSASDGRGKGITAPNPAGPRLAVERAWQAAGLPLQSLGLLEAHGTSTAVGDAVEGQVMSELFGAAQLAPHSVPMGSVKSQIGHLKSAAGAASLIKAVLSLHHKVIPGSLHCDEPNPKIPFERSPFFVPPTSRPWENRDPASPRVAAVSSFGFGGTNFHAVLTEHHPEQSAGIRSAGGSGGGTETPAVRSESTANGSRRQLALGAADTPALRRRLTERLEQPAESDPNFAAPEVRQAAERLVIDYGSDTERAARGRLAQQALRDDAPPTWRALGAQGVFRGRGAPGRVAFLFPGQGSQSVGMLRELFEQEPVVADTFAEADRFMAPHLGRPLSEFVFAADCEQAQAALRDTTVCQPAMLTADIALLRLFAARGITPDMVAGHSLGEYSALVAAGMLEFGDALLAVSARAKEMAGVRVDDPGLMAAVFAPMERIQQALDGIEGVVPANHNSHGQTVLGGATRPMEAALAALERAGIKAVPLNVSHAFHTPIVAPAREPLRRMLGRLELRAPRIPLVANVDALPYDAAPTAREANLDRLAQQVASPVRFVESLQALHRLGARLFIECGPRKVLSGFVLDVLGDDPQVVAVSANQPKLGDRASFAQALAACAAGGLPAPEPAAVLEPVAVAACAPDPASVVISGVSLGLPGEDHPVFDPDNTERILGGYRGIDPIPQVDRELLAAQRIVRLVKDAPGGPVFEVIDNPEGVAKLTGRKGPFDLAAEFGLDPERVDSYDITTRLALAAGLLALGDAGIPLVRHYQRTRAGAKLPLGWRLPPQLADETGVIFASAFPGVDQLVGELSRKAQDQAVAARLEELRALAETVGPLHEVQRRIAALEQRLDGAHGLDRKFIFRALSLGHAQLAEHIGARGPNVQVNAACASTTLALTIAADWIRLGRCRRVLVVGADDITNPNLAPWLVGGLLATGAVTTAANWEEAALPFDRRRAGMIPGMGAAGLVVESSEAAADRGRSGLTRLLGAVVVNSAFHGTRLDPEHIAGAMERLLSEVEHSHGLSRRELAGHTVFVSHETYTPARGGSASAEVHALRRGFGDLASELVIANTKGFTGHPMAVGIEDAAAVLMLEHGRVPPVPNHREVDPDLGVLNLSRGGNYPVRYALRLAAGFGSQLVLTLSERVDNPRRVDEARERAWLARISGQEEPRLEVVANTLRVCEPVAATTAATQPVAIRTEPATQPPPVEVVVTPVAPTPPVEAAVTQQVAPAPAAAAPDRAAVERQILELVARKTGYPLEMLALDLDLEADLGIDTVKQAEMFSEVRSTFGIPPQRDMKLADYPTLGHVVRFALERRETPAALAQETAPATPPVEVVVTPVAPTPPVGAAVTQQVAPAPAAAAPDRAAVERQILELVARKTGYPLDMLALDLDLEADLGIDTVKQAEMFSEVRSTFGIPPQRDMKLADYPTLGHVVRFALERRETPAALAQETAPAAPPVETGADNPPPPDDLRFLVPRLVGRPEAADCSPSGARMPGRCFLVGGDDGLAATLATALARRGGTSLRLKGEPEAVAEEAARLALTQPPDGVILLPPVGTPVPLDTDDDERWRRALDARARLPFRLAQVLEPVLANRPGAFFVAAVRQDGLLGFGPLGPDDPLSGATTGLVKALAREWPQVLAKVVDIGALESPGRAAEALLDEVAYDRSALEIGFGSRGRFGLAVEPLAAPARKDALPDLPPDPVVLVTGGSGGIVSAVVADLAARQGGTYWLISRADPCADDDPDARLLRSDRPRLQAELAERLQRAGQRATPVLVEREIRVLERRLAATESLAAVRRAGGRAEHAALEITDPAAVRQLVERIRERCGRLDMVIHAAGVDYSGALARKTSADFDRVLAVKADGLRSLLRALRDTGLERPSLVTFGSIAGRFGNAAQVDYAAANDLLSAATRQLAAVTGARPALTLAYSAWAERGMASRGSVPEVMRQLGIEPIPLALGGASLSRALRAGARGECVVARALGALETDPELQPEGLRRRLAAEPQRYPVLERVVGWTSARGLELEVVFDPERDAYLRDHRIGDTVVVPGVMAVECFAEAARLLHPGQDVVAVEDLCFDAPLKLYRGEPRRARLFVRLVHDDGGLALLAEMETHRALAGDREQTVRHYSGRVRLDQAPTPPRSDWQPPAGGRPIDRDTIYRTYFHGPSFQVVERAEAGEDGALTAWLSDGRERPPLGRTGELAAVPMLAELAFQAAGLVEVQQHQRLALPAGVERLAWHRPPAGARGEVRARVVPVAVGSETRYAVQVTDERGYVLLTLDGYRTSPLLDAAPRALREAEA